MGITLTAINSALPRFDALRRNYMADGTTGLVDSREYLQAAFADIDPETGEITITIYGQGDALEPRHYIIAETEVE